MGWRQGIGYRGEELAGDVLGMRKSSDGRVSWESRGQREWGGGRERGW
jgi:hypothetical protein